jgi:hypothetical protein
MGAKLDVGEILQGTTSTLSANAGAAAVYVGVLGAIGSVIDLYGAYFGLSLLSGLGIVLGIVLLVIPGIVLLVRWLPAYAILLSEDTDVPEALSQSWERTRSQFWPVLAAVLLVLLLGAASAAIYAASEISSAVPEEAAIIAGNLALTLTSAVFTALGVAVYRLLGAKADTLGEVFA